MLETQLGGTAETVHVPGPEGVTNAAKSVQEMVGKAKAAAQGPLDTVRGTGEQETMHAPRDRQRSRPHSDRRDGHLGRDKQPELAVNVVHDTIPISQIDAGRRTARHAKTPSRGARARRGPSGPRERRKAAEGCRRYSDTCTALRASP